MDNRPRRPLLALDDDDDDAANCCGRWTSFRWIKTFMDRMLATGSSNDGIFSPSLSMELLRTSLVTLSSLVVTAALVACLTGGLLRDSFDFGCGRACGSTSPIMVIRLEVEELDARRDWWDVVGV